MAAKTVQVSDDSGSNYYTLPGSSADFSDNAGTLDDTIFGQNYKSSQTNLIDWQVTSDAVYKGFAGYVVTLKQQGTSTAMTGEAMTLVSTRVYKITNIVKSMWDSAGTFVVYDGGVDHTADVLSIDFLFGIVTFKAAYTVTGAVTVDGKYWTTTAIAKSQKYQLTQSMSPIDNTDIPTAQGNSGHRTMAYGLKTLAIQLDSVYNTTPTWRAALIARSTILVEIAPDGGTKSVFRGYFKPTSRKQAGNVGALETETINLELQVPTTNLLVRPAGWYFTSTDLSTSVVKCLNAFINETTMKVKYLPDGGTTSNAGLVGDCLVANVTLSGGIDSMNTFSLTLQGTGAATAV